MVLVDSNVLIDVLEDDEIWLDWSVRQLRHISQLHDLVINPVIYAELSLTFGAVEDLDAAIAEMQVRVVNIPRAALFLAGKAFVQYRRRGGMKNGVLPDFFIGAHAAVMGWPILTRDPRRYRSYFEIAEIIAP